MGGSSGITDSQLEGKDHAVQTTTQGEREGLWEIVQQLVSSIPHEVSTSTCYGQKEQGSNTRRKIVTFVDQVKKGEKVERILVQDCLTGKTNKEKSQRVQDQPRGQGSLI